MGTRIHSGTRTQIFSQKVARTLRVVHNKCTHWSNGSAVRAKAHVRTDATERIIPLLDQSYAVDNNFNLDDICETILNGIVI